MLCLFLVRMEGFMVTKYIDRMSKLLESKVTAWIAMLLVVALVVLSFLLHTPWWGFIGIFFCFLGVFAHLSSLYLRRMSRSAGRKLETTALICIILAVVALVVEYAAFDWQL